MSGDEMELEGKKMEDSFLISGCEYDKGEEQREAQLTFLNAMQYKVQVIYSAASDGWFHY